MPDESRVEATAAASPDERGYVRRVLIALGLTSVFVAGFLLLFYAPDAVILTFAAVWFGCFLHFTAAAVSRWTGLSEGWSLGLLTTLLVALLVGFFVLLGWQAASRVNELVTGLQGSVADLEARLTEQFPQAKTFLKQMPSPAQTVQDLSASPTVRGLLWSPFGFLIYALFVFFTGLYLAGDRKRYADGFASLFPPARRPEVRAVMTETGAALWKWTLARLASMTLVGLLTWLGLWLLGIPMAATLGIFTGLVVFIPNVGPMLSLLPPMLLAFQQGPWMPAYVVLLFTGIQLVESYLITPLIHQREDNLPAAIVIVSQLLFGILFGMLGVMFAMPISLAAMIWVQRFYVGQTLQREDAEEKAAHSDRLDGAPGVG